MPSLNKFEKSIEKISEIFNEKIANNPYSKELRIIFNVGLQSKDLALFPNIRSASSCSDYIEKWIKCYVDATQNPPSKRKASPKGSCNDPALENIVYYATGEEKKQIKRMLAYHNLFMSAENIQGNLLEEYINNNIQKYGVTEPFFKQLIFAQLMEAYFYRLKIKTTPKTVHLAKYVRELL